MVCTLNTNGWTGLLYAWWDEYRTPCCDPECGSVGGETNADFRPVGQDYLSEEYPCGDANMQLHVKAEWCANTVGLVDLVCEMSSGDVRTWTLYNYHFDGDRTSMGKSFCFGQGFPGYPTQCHLISFGGNFIGSSLEDLLCTNCTPGSVVSDP